MFKSLQQQDFWIQIIVCLKDFFVQKLEKDKIQSCSDWGSSVAFPLDYQ
jgi:hypothetical protein